MKDFKISKFVSTSFYLSLALFILIYLKFTFALDFVPHLVLPEGAGMFNVIDDFGATGDGTTDDTEALQRAFSGDTTQEKGGYRAVYIPEGIYLIRDKLVFGDKKKVIFGAGRDRTIIKLADSSPGYDNPDSAKYVVSTKDIKYGADYLRADNFYAHVKHLTIEIGNNNPGAIALSFHTNNSGAVYDVDLICPDGSAHTGLDLTQVYFGPGYVKDVRIDGFAYGVRADWDHFSSTLENITIKNASICGVTNDSSAVSISNLVTESCKKAVINRTRYAMMTIIGGTLSGADGDTAILNEDDGGLLVRDVSIDGYSTGIVSFDSTETKPIVNEWLSHPVLSLFNSPDSTLGIPIAKTPELPYDPLDKCIVMPMTGDITDTLQYAIDQGFSTIYIPHGGGKTITQTITVHGKVHRIMGLGNAQIVYATAGTPAWRIEDGESPVVIFENVYSDYDSDQNYMFEQATTRDLVLKCGSASYHNTVDGAMLYAENIVGEPWHLTNMHAWIRDLNTETYDFIHVVNNNSTLWLLGHKTEKDQTNIQTINGGRTELLGGLIFKNNHRLDHPAFVIDNAHATLSYRVKAKNDPYREGDEIRPEAYYKVHVQEIRGTDTLELVTDSTHHRRSIVYAGYTAEAYNTQKSVIASSLRYGSFFFCADRKVVTLQLNKPQNMSLSLYSLSGKRITTLVSKKQFKPGIHQINIENIKMGRGVFILKAAGEGLESSRTIVIHR